MITRFAHDSGLEVFFRQWKADSHCRFLHCYSLALKIEHNGDWLQSHEDYVLSLRRKTLIAKDDPQIEFVKTFAERFTNGGIIIPAVGCEMTSHYMFHELQNRNLDVQRVTIYEHEANFASYGVVQ